MAVQKLPLKSPDEIAAELRKIIATCNVSDEEGEIDYRIEQLLSLALALTDIALVEALQKIVNIGTDHLDGKFPMDIAYEHADRTARAALASYKAGMGDGGKKDGHI